MSKFWSKVTQQIEPYTPGEQPREDNLVKLNTNENPYPPGDRVLDAMRTACADSLRLYPDPEAEELREAIAQRYGVRKEEVFVGNGSDEILAHVFNGLLKQDQPVLFPDISYSFYPVYCRLYEIESVTVPLDENLRINLGDYDRPNGGIIFPNPNAPTGAALPLSEIESLLRRNTESVVVIDEAYVDFGAESAVSLIDHFSNLLVVQTLSKSRSLAGLRLGYAFGNTELIDGLSRIKNSFNSYPIDRIAQCGGIASMQDQETFENNRQKVIATRATLIENLEALGMEVVPSAANFVFARYPGKSGTELMTALRQRSILVRHFDKPRISDYLRITVGTDAECAALVSALRDILA